MSSQDIGFIPPSHMLALPRPGKGPQVMISRTPFTQKAFDDIHLKTEKDDQLSACQKVRDKLFCSRKRLWRLLTKYIPLIKFIRYYNFKESAITDIFAGLSVGTIHIPQALAFGLLSSAKVENGLLTSLWPVIIYVFFGTSAHISMGTSAVICILTAATVDREGAKWVADKPWILSQVGNGTVLDEIPEYLDFKEQVAMGLTLIVGIMMVIMGLLRLGFITAYLSDSFFAAFTSAAAVHIGVSQLPAMLGIKIPRFAGIFKIVKMFEAIFDRISYSNFGAIIISIICCAIIWFVKEAINERYKKKLFAPIPIELFIVIFGTVASYFGEFKQKFGIDVVGVIPTGIPLPVVPTEGLKVASSYIVDAFVLSILIFAYTIAIAKICAKKHNYEVDDSQEFLAYGLCNLGSAFLQCIPSCVAPPRSMVASTMNAKSTLNGIFSAALMLLIILIVVKLFTDLPKSVLAAIIFIALKNLFIQIKDFAKYWRINKFDFVIWLFTFFATVFLDIDVGLGVGVGISVVCVIFQTQFARGYKIGYTNRDPTLVEHKRYKDSLEVPGVKVFRFESSLYFATAEVFRTSLYKCTVNPRKLLKALQKREKNLKKINEERAAQGLTSDNSAGLYTIGSTNFGYHNSAPDLTTLPELRNITATSEQDKARFRISDSDLSTTPNSPTNESLSLPNGNSGSPKTDGPGVKRVRLPSIDRPVFIYQGDTPQFLDDSKVGLHTTKDAVMKLPGGGEAVKMGILKSTESMVSLYSINFDEYDEDSEDGEDSISDERLRQMRKIHHIIIDCGPINYIDASGTNVLCYMFTEFSHVNIKLYLANCSSYIRHTMQLAGVFDKIPPSHFFVDVHDAVSFAKPQKPLPIKPENLRDFSDEEAIEGSRVVNA